MSAALSAEERRGAAIRWLRAHLFHSVGDGAITVTTLVLGGWALVHVLRWVFVTANWAVIHANLRLLLVGRFPVGEEWRIWIPVLTVAALAGASWGALHRAGWPPVAAMAAVAGGLLLLPGAAARPYVVALVVLFFGGLALGRFASASHPMARWYVLRALVLGWLGVWPIAILLLVIFGGVDVQRWGGLYLNVIVTAAGAMGALPIGVLIALGRRSQYRVIRACCSVYVEIARGLPLMVVLILTWLAIQQFLPSLWGINQIGLVPRILAAYILFTAAYVGVCVTGGLNSLPKGQAEAAAALGLDTFQAQRYVLLPQAMRRALPALVGELIDLLMASTLVSVLGLTDVLAAARATTEQPAFFGRQKEVLLFVGAVFWVTAFSLSRLGRAAERALSPREAGGTVQR